MLVNIREEVKMNASLAQNLWQSGIAWWYGYEINMNTKTM